jgi:acyl-CoA reductase-like NAD-dependent aldehyde dehydrogenase
VLLASKALTNPDFPGAQVRTPVLLACDAADEHAYMQERFGPISFVVKVADSASAIALSERMVDRHGALTTGIYSTKPDVIDEMTAATWRSKVALSINLTSNVYVNQSSSYSDYHGTGGNPAGKRRILGLGVCCQPFSRCPAPLSRVRSHCHGIRKDPL